MQKTRHKQTPTISPNKPCCQALKEEETQTRDPAPFTWPQPGENAEMAEVGGDLMFQQKLPT